MPRAGQVAAVIQILSATRFVFDEGTGSAGAGCWARMGPAQMEGAGEGRGGGGGASGRGGGGVGAGVGCGGAGGGAGPGTAACGPAGERKRRSAGSRGPRSGVGAEVLLGVRIVFRQHLETLLGLPPNVFGRIAVPVRMERQGQLAEGAGHVLE